jgi:hypothetical protein
MKVVRVDRAGISKKKAYDEDRYSLDVSDVDPAAFGVTRIRSIAASEPSLFNNEKSDLQQ